MPGPRILVVDDDGDTIRTLTDALTDEGYEVRGLDSWHGVPRALHAFLPQVIVLDLLMPGISGVQLLEMLRRHPNALYRAIPIIVLSGAGEKTVRTWALSHGAAAFLAKPCALEDLLAALQAALV